MDVILFYKSFKLISSLNNCSNNIYFKEVNINPTIRSAFIIYKGTIMEERVSGLIIRLHGIILEPHCKKKSTVSQQMKDDR